MWRLPSASTLGDYTPTGLQNSKTLSRGMEAANREGTPRNSTRMLSRLLGKLRGVEHKLKTVDKASFTTILSESTESDSMKFEDEENAHTPSSVNTTEDVGPNIDLRYEGQCLTPEQLPEFCDQLHRLVDVIRNIQDYAKVTGEYPSELERRLNEEAREVASLAAEARNARDVVTRTRAQRRAVRAQRRQLVGHLNSLRDTEARELESTVRMSDRKLFRSWESLKESKDAAAFEPLLDEIRNKQAALECLVRLIENRQSNLGRQVLQPLASTISTPSNEHGASNTRKRHESNRRATYKRRRKDGGREVRSVPLSNEPSQHSPNSGPECTSRYRVDGEGAVVITPFVLTSRGSVMEI